MAYYPMGGALGTENAPSIVAYPRAFIDAFSRLRVSTPETLFDSKLIYDAGSIFWDDQQTSGSGTTSTFNTNQASVTLAVAASTAGTRVRQTYQRFLYQAGKSMMAMMTGVLGNPATGITKRIGLFDGSNGMYFESSGSAVLAGDHMTRPNISPPLQVAGPITEPRILGADKSIFGEAVVAVRIPQISVQFDRPIANQGLAVQEAGGGSVTQNDGLVHVESGGAGYAKIATAEYVRYLPGREVYAVFTASFAPPDALSNQRAGIFDDQNGFFIGYQGVSFGITKRSSGADVFTAMPDFNVDTLSMEQFSHFTRGLVAETLAPANLNVYRIRYGWLGSAIILFEIMAPDGQWVLFHAIRQPNISPAASIENPNLPFTMEVFHTAPGGQRRDHVRVVGRRDHLLPDSHAESLQAH